MTWALALARGEALSIRSGRSVPAWGCGRGRGLSGEAVTVTHLVRGTRSVPQVVGQTLPHQRPREEGQGSQLLTLVTAVALSDYALSASSH